MTVDWTRPIEVVNTETGETRPAKFVLDDGTNCLPIEVSLAGLEMWFKRDGTFGDYQVRNVAEQPSAEVAELMAWKAKAIERFPELAIEVDPDIAEAEKLKDEYWQGDCAVVEIILTAIKRGRKLERAALGVDTAR